MRSLDENERVKDIVEFFEKNSNIKYSVGNVVLYLISIYYYDPKTSSGEAFLALLFIERDSSGYTIKINYLKPEPEFLKEHSEKEIEKRVEEWFGGFVRLLEKTLSSKNPVANKLVEIATYSCWKAVITISFLYEIYGDDILNDDTIPGIHSVCSYKARFFSNDKVVVIPDLYLWVVRDTRSNKIFKYETGYRRGKHYEVPQDDKIFFEALFIGSRDLFEPDAVFVDRLGDKYAFSSSKAVVDGKEMSLVAVGTYDPRRKYWDYLKDIFVITCGESGENGCSAYSFNWGQIIKGMNKIKEKAPAGTQEAFPWYIIRSEKTHVKAKAEVAKKFIERNEWEILPA